MSYYGYIYKTINLVNNKIYVGKKKGSIEETESYLGSGKILLDAIKKYGRENFKKEILCICSSFSEQNEKEKYWISQLNSRDLTIGYNIGLGGEFGDVFTNHPDKEKIREKIRKAITGVKHPEWRNDLKSQVQTGKKHKKYSDKGRSNCSEAQKRLYNSGYTSHRKGKKLNNEQKQKALNGLKKGVTKAWENRKREGTCSDFAKKIWETRRKNAELRKEQVCLDLS